MGKIEKITLLKFQNWYDHSENANLGPGFAIYFVVFFIGIWKFQGTHITLVYPKFVMLMCYAHDESTPPREKSLKYNNISFR